MAVRSEVALVLCATRVRPRIARDVNQAALMLAAAEKGAEASRKGLEQAVEEFRVVKERFDIGRGIQLEILDAQVAVAPPNPRRARRHQRLEPRARDGRLGGRRLRGDAPPALSPRSAARTDRLSAPQRRYRYRCRSVSHGG